MDRKFKVIESKDHSGLTVGSYSRKPGYIFSEKQWSGDSKSLEAAIKNGRCEEIKEVEKESKKKEDEKVNKKEIKKRIKELEKEYSTIEDSESEEAKDILSIIEDLEEELK